MPWVRLRIPGPPANLPTERDTRYGRALEATVPNRLLSYRADETSGPAAHHSAPPAPGHNGVRSPATPLGAPPRITEGHSFGMNREDRDHGYAPHAGKLIQGLDTLTFGTWVYTTNSSENDFMIDASTGSITGGISLRVGADNRLYLNIQLDTGRNFYRTDDNALMPGTTAFVVVSWTSGQNVHLYVNGAEVPLVVVEGSSAPSGVIVNPDDLSFGKWRQTEVTDHYLQGRMDEIFLARAYLAVDQVRAVL